VSEEELKAFRNLNTFSTKYIVNKKASSENDIATMFIYIAKLEVELEHKDKEIERLNKEIETLKQPQVFIDTQDMEERYGEELYKEYLEKENKRLNNIINGLEKMLEQTIENSAVQPHIEMAEYTLKELKELKGSENNGSI